MKKSDSKSPNKSIEEELKRLPKENKSLKSGKDTSK